MQMTDEDALDGPGIDLGSQNLLSTTLTTIHQVCVVAKCESHA